MYSKTKINLLYVVPIAVLLVIVLALLTDSRLNLPQNSFAQIMPATLPTERGISGEDNQSTSVSEGIQQNISLVNSSNIIQSALLPSQLPITPVSSTSNIHDEDDDDDDNDKTKSSNEDDDDDDDDDNDKTKSSNEDDDDDDGASNRRSVSISSGGGVSVSIR